MKFIYFTLATVFTCSSFGCEDNSQNKEAVPTRMREQIYMQLFQQIHPRWMEQVMHERRDCLDSIVESLDLQLPTQEMREVFDHHRAIMHRRPHNQELVIGCGNLPAYNPSITVYDIDYG